jgi:hypothetical protein
LFPYAIFLVWIWLPCWAITGAAGAFMYPALRRAAPQLASLLGALVGFLAVSAFDSLQQNTWLNTAIMALASSGGTALVLFSRVKRSNRST